MGYPMDYQNPAMVMEEIASLVPFYADATYLHLEKGGVQSALETEESGDFQSLSRKNPWKGPSPISLVDHPKRIPLPLWDCDHY